MNLTGEEVLQILARHNVSVPVGALIDLGLVRSNLLPERRQPQRRAGLSHGELMNLARQGKRIRWFYSGVVERVHFDSDRNCIMAGGVFTVHHPLPSRAHYNCSEQRGTRLKDLGDPKKVPRTLLTPLKQKELYGFVLPFHIGKTVRPKVEGTFGDHRDHPCVLEKVVSSDIDLVTGVSTVWWDLWCLPCKKHIGSYDESQLSPTGSIPPEGTVTLQVE